MAYHASALLTCLLLIGTSPPPVPARASIDDAGSYRQDLASFDRQMKATHPGLFEVHSVEEWDAAVKALGARAGELDTIGFYLGLSRIAALAQDGHTAVSPPEAFRRTAFPLAMAFFGEDLYVTCADARLRDVVGGRVVAIGEAPAARIMTDLEAVSMGDNRWGARGRWEFLLRHGALHRRLGWSKAGDESITVAFEDGREVRVMLNRAAGGSATVRGPLPPHGPAPTGWITAREGETQPQPFWQQRLREPWWFVHIEGTDCIYVAFNSVTDRPGEPLTEFWARLFRAVETEDVARMVIDMRHNGGGDGYKNQPLVHALIRSDDVNLPGHLFVLTGPRTFSAAIMGIAEIEKQTYALFVGEPSGAGPAHHGDATTLTLPKTGQRVRCSTVRHQFSDGRDKRQWIHPDLPAPVTFDDFVNGRDPALDAALRYDAADAKAFGEWPPMAHWMRPTQRDVPARGGK